jgi:hypothetical protein
MPTWGVQNGNNNDERVEAGMLATESGTLVAFSEEGLMVQAWAPGQWWTVRQLSGLEAHPAGKGYEIDGVVVGLRLG